MEMHGLNSTFEAIWKKILSQQKRAEEEFPFSYELPFKSVEKQKASKEWCTQTFDSSQWFYEPDLDGTFEFRFKTADQLIQFKLRWQ